MFRFEAREQGVGLVRVFFPSVRLFLVVLPYSFCRQHSIRFWVCTRGFGCFDVGAFDYSCLVFGVCVAVKPSHFVSVQRGIRKRGFMWIIPWCCRVFE